MKQIIDNTVKISFVSQIIFCILMFYFHANLFFVALYSINVLVFFCSLIAYMIMEYNKK